MKRRLLLHILIGVLFVLFCGVVSVDAYSNKRYLATCLRGGTTGCLDKLNGLILSAGDFSHTNDGTRAYFHALKDSGCSAVESDSNIFPDSNPGTKCWEEVSASDMPVTIGTDGQVIISDGSSTSWISLSGDITITNAGVAAISNDTIGPDEMADADHIGLEWLAGVGYVRQVTVEAKVNEAGGITKGQVVYVTGATGDRAQVALADNTLHDKAHNIGIAAETGANNDNIEIITSGMLTNTDTTLSDYTEGALLHLSISGSMTKAIPTNGAHIHVARVTKYNGSTGILLINPEIYVHDVRGTTDLDIKLATGSDDGTRKILFENYSGTDLGYMDGAGDFNWGTSNAFNITTGGILSGGVLAGDVSGSLDATQVDSVQVNSVALTTDTTGNYAAGDAEAGNALTGDSATAFFSSGEIEDARVVNDLTVNSTKDITTTEDVFVGDACVTITPDGEDLCVEGDAGVGGGLRVETSVTLPDNATLDVYNDSALTANVQSRISNYSDSLNSKALLGFYKYGGTKASPTVLDINSYGHLGGNAFYLYHGATPIERLSLVNISLVSPLWNFVDDKEFPESYFSFRGNRDGAAHHNFRVTPEGIIVSKHDENYYDFYPDAELTVSGDAEIYNSDTLNSEVLSDTADFSQATWTKSPDFVDGVYTHSSGTGTLSQAEADFSTTVKDDARYLVNVRYTITDCPVTGTATNLTSIILGTEFIKNPHSEANTMFGNDGAHINSGVNNGGWADQANNLRYGNCTNIACQRVYQGASAISSFDIDVTTSGACVVTFALASAKAVNGGDLTVAGNISASSRTFTGSDASSTPIAPTRDTENKAWTFTLADDDDGVCDLGIDCITLPNPTTTTRFSVTDDNGTAANFSVSPTGAVRPVSSQSIITTTRRFTAAEVKTLKTAEELVPLVSGTFLQLQSAQFFLSPGTSGFTQTAGGDDLAIEYDDGTGTQIILFDSDAFITTAPGSFGVQNLYPVDLALSFSADFVKNISILNVGANEFGGNAEGDGYLTIATSYIASKLATGISYENTCDSADLDAALCIYDAGTNAVIHNDTGGSRTVVMEMWGDIN